MKLLLDEMLSPEIARVLRARGHDVQAIKEHPEWIGLTDEDVLQLAREERRAIVTNNVRDYRPLHYAAVASGQGHYGMVFVPAGFRRTRADVGRLAAALERELGRYPADRGLADAECWL